MGRHTAVDFPPPNTLTLISLKMRWKMVLVCEVVWMLDYTNAHTNGYVLLSENVALLLKLNGWKVSNSAPTH